ncbi:MAG: methionine aminotransferase [Flavobacteriaceae bacterium]|nr:methionine aminotransferase [Bacteroidia bacterium]MBT8287714.1 methionine aminotransferase [Bacteroidia bacterium]NNF73929.1 methionine aminotransferase [Flavobacteriaceae bacterium]NNK72352.1 methionine aminotransferase [Flavobacteriaceae bacterium]
MRILTSKLPALETTIFAVMSALANKHNAINLSQGYPNFPSDPKLMELVNKAMKGGFNQYAHMNGEPALRQAIANKFELLYDITYHPENEIIVTAGATQAIYTAITAVIHPGDEVIVFRPAYDSYVPSIELNGGKPVSIQLSSPDYKIDWDVVRKKITSRTRMIMINSPHNPSGTVLSEGDLLNLQQITSGTDILVLSDEVYEHIIFEESHQSVCRFPELKTRSFITASFGKTFHNTGWKIGYCCGPKDLMDEFLKVHQFNVFSVNHPMQVALAEYLKNADHFLQLSEFYQKKRDLFLDLVGSSRFKFNPSKGTYFQAADYSAISTENDMEFSRWLTVEKGVACIPVSAFNLNKKDDHMVRFCFAKTDETLKQAAEILCKL